MWTQVIVITPPFGYWKDRNTNTVQLHPEAAETVRMIYSLYLQGFGQKEITRKLNDLGRKTPAQLRAEQCGREVRVTHKTRDNRYLWTYASVKNVLTEEAYTGVLINHRSETQDGKAKGTPISRNKITTQINANNTLCFLNQSIIAIPHN